MMDVDGIVKMAVGYCESGRYVVMERPLKFYKGKIVNVNKHNGIEYLNFMAAVRVVKAKMQLRTRWCCFFDEKCVLMILEDEDV